MFNQMKKIKMVSQKMNKSDLIAILKLLEDGQMRLEKY